MVEQKGQGCVEISTIDEVLITPVDVSTPVGRFIAGLRVAGVTDDCIRGFFINTCQEFGSESLLEAIEKQPDRFAGRIADFIENGCRNGDFAV